MNKLKERLFEISLGAVGIVLLALVYFLVVAPLGELHKKQAEVEKRTKSIAGLNRRAQPPVKEVFEAFKARNSANEAALKEAEDFYEEQAKPFRTYFNGTVDPPVLNEFDGQYKDGIKKLVDDYRGGFKIAVDPAQPETAPPKVSKIDPMEEALIAMAMKEYWILQEVFAALTKLQIGGLKEVEFPPRGVEPKDSLAHRRFHSVTVKVEMPFGKVENLLTELFSCKQVPFLLEDLTVAKSPELMAPFLTMEKAVDFKEVEAASKESYEELVSEPLVVVTLKLAGMEWKGLPAPVGEAKPEDGTKPENSAKPDASEK